MICVMWTYAPQTLYSGKYNVSTLTKRSGNISIIAGRDDVTIDSTRVIFIIPMGTLEWYKRYFIVSRYNSYPTTIDISVKIVSTEKLVMTTKRKKLSSPYTDMANTLFSYHLDCTIHTKKPVAFVA